MQKIIFLAFLAVCYSHNTWWGPTGFIHVPTTTIVREKETAISSRIAFSGEDEYLGLSASFAFSDTMEVSLADTFGYSRRSGSGSVFSVKYVPVENFAFGVMLDGNARYRNTAYTVFGSASNSVYLGGGFHFGSGNQALLGNYSRISSEMEAVFFMAGAKMDLSSLYPSLEAMVEFNGDTMSVGLGWIPMNQWDMQIDFMSSGDLIRDDQFMLSVGTKF